ncbi:MAG: M1 family aminopeptidase [Bacteroidales bacterium]|nr:M1 family aminopeptidase [Bacteroidales bacterium]
MKNLIICNILALLCSISNIKASHYDSIDVVHYEITLEITDFTNQIITGYTELKIIPKMLPLDKIHLDLLELIIDSIMVNNQKVPNFTYDDRTIQIPLNTPATTYDTITVVVYYFGHPQEDPGPDKWGGFKWTSNSAFNLGVGFAAIPHCFGRVWFPCNDDFEDRATYTFNIITNAALNHWAVCNGKLVNHNTTCSGKRVCRWEMLHPIPTYLASVAVGEYVCVKDTFQGILGSIPIELWVNPADTLKAKNSFINLKNILHLFESKFGPYRWQRVGYVSVDFSSGAMEHATNIAYPKLAINGNTTYEKLYAHELFHHWFGNLITCKKAEEMWINEGWARFSEFIHDEAYAGYSTYIKNKRAMLHDVLRFAHIEDSGFFALNNIPQYNTYGMSSYEKGALMVLNLRQFLGDSLFYSIFTQFLNDKAFQPVSSEDIRDYLVQHTIPEVSNFFETYIFTPGFPHFSIDSIKTEPFGNAYRCIIYSKEKLRHRNTFSTYAKSRATLMDSQWNTYTFDICLRNGYGIDTVIVPIQPVVAFADLYEEVNDATTDEFKKIKTTGNITFDKTFFTAQVLQLPDSAFLQVTHNWVAADPFKQPIPGLLVSKERYWDVKGIIPNGAIMKGRFQYIRSNNVNAGALDNELITGSIDSLVLLYRPNRSANWQIVSATRAGTPYSGYLVVDTLKIGEYAFGYWNWNQWITVKENFEDKELLIYPNPNNGHFTISYPFKKDTEIEIFDNQLRLIFNTKLISDTTQITINNLNTKPNMYYVRVIQKDQKILWKKFIVY